MKKPSPNFLFLLSLLILTGCNPFASLRPDSKTLLSRGWADVSPQSPPNTLHCYRTLGDHQCYEANQVGQEDRLVGEYKTYTPPISKTSMEKVFDQNS
jgi:hypothetical protein